jgi:tetratricopeptide (TPR) repeat protein
MQVQYLNFWMFGDLRGDDSWDELNKLTPGGIDNFYVSNDDAIIKSTWQNYYNVIFSANTVLQKIQDADPLIITDKDRYIGEAKFMRALAYFDLVRIFGDVPLITAPVSIADSYKTPREKAAKVYSDVIIKDLQDAELKLPVSYSGINTGRATSGAAKSILGRVYMTLGDFVNAEAKLQEVTGMGYALLSDYNDLFNYNKDEHHSEYIFDIEYERGIGEGNTFNADFMPNSAKMLDFYGVIGPGRDFNSPTPQLYAAFSDSDKRKDITVGVNGGFYDNDGNFIPFFLVNAQGYTKKYIAPSIPGDCPANWKVIRYADVLLMYAEALNENNKTAEALDFLNQVRRRAGVGEYAGLTQQQARDSIALERRLELSFEGVRWFDLVRTGKAEEALQSKGMQPYMTIFPIPLSQIQLVNNQSIFPQNPGYN